MDQFFKTTLYSLPAGNWFAETNLQKNSQHPFVFLWAPVQRSREMKGDDKAVPRWTSMASQNDESDIFMGNFNRKHNWTFILSFFLALEEGSLMLLIYRWGLEVDSLLIRLLNDEKPLKYISCWIFPNKVLQLLRAKRCKVLLILKMPSEPMSVIPPVIRSWYCL